MNHTVIYLHGQGGNADEAKHYAPLFEGCDVIGVDYNAKTPWEANEELPGIFDSVCGQAQKVTLIANSIGAFFAMSALSEKKIDQAFLISPIVNMVKLTEDMMTWAGVSEAALLEKGVIETDFGQTLSWRYLSYVRNHPINWKIPTHILYAGHDHLTSMQTMSEFAAQTRATLTVMENVEHWFHTQEQMAFLDRWIQIYAHH